MNIPVCVCVCVCVCMFMWFMWTQICIMIWVWHRYYKEKVIYEDIFSVHIIQNAYKSFRVSFLGGRNAPSPVRAKFRCRVGVNSTYSLYSIRTITPMERPRKPHMPDCVCVCVCLCVHIRYKIIFNKKNKKITHQDITNIKYGLIFSLTLYNKMSFLGPVPKTNLSRK